MIPRILVWTIMRVDGDIIHETMKIGEGGGLTVVILVCDLGVVGYMWEGQRVDSY